MFAIYSNWIRHIARSWSFAAEAQAVIGLRMAKLAMGDAAALQEAQRMVSEKVVAAAEVQMKTGAAILSGRPHTAPATALAHYHRKVRANRRRLSR